MFVAYSNRPISPCWTSIRCAVVCRGVGVGEVGVERAVEQILAMVLLIASFRAQ